MLIAPDRAKALALLSTTHPDLILVDVNGQTLEFLDAIRSGEGFAGRADPDSSHIRQLASRSSNLRRSHHSWHIVRPPGIDHDHDEPGRDPAQPDQSAAGIGPKRALRCAAGGSGLHPAARLTPTRLRPDPVHRDEGAVRVDQLQGTAGILDHIEVDVLAGVQMQHVADALDRVEAAV